MTLRSEVQQEIHKTILLCPKCQGELEVWWQRNQNLWCVMHDRRTSCPVEEFGRSRRKDEGGTPQEALGRARSAIESLLSKQL